MLYIFLLLVFGPFVGFSAWGIWDAHQQRLYSEALAKIQPLTVVLGIDLSNFIENMKKLDQAFTKFANDLVKGFTNIKDE